MKTVSDSQVIEGLMSLLDLVYIHGSTNFKIGRQSTDEHETRYVWHEMSINVIDTFGLESQSITIVRHGACAFKATVRYEHFVRTVECNDEGNLEATIIELQYRMS